MTRPTFSRRRRRRDTAPTSGVVVKGLATLAVLGAFVYIATTAFNGVPGKDYTTMFVDAKEVGNLRIHDNVSIGGVRVGQVITSEATPEGRARVEIQLEPDVVLSRDTVVRIRANGLLGARLVQLIPGDRPERLREGDTIRAADDARTYGVTDALDTFDAETRGALGTTVRSLGTGLLGNGRRLNDGLRDSSDAARPFQVLFREIRVNGAIERLVPALESAMRPLAGSRRELTALIAAADAGLKPFAEERTALQETLSAAPPALATATTGLAKGQRLLVAADALVRSADRTLTEAPVGLRHATALLQEARDPVRRTDDLLDDAADAVPAALQITSALRPVLKPLDAAIDDLRPIVREVGRYGCDLNSFGQVFRSMTGFGGVGEGPNGPAMQFRLQALGGAEVLGTNVKVNPVRDAYPEPCKYKGGTYLTTIPKLDQLGVPK